MRDPDLPKLHFAVAFKGASWTDADAIPLMVIQSIIGAWSKGSAGGDWMFNPLSVPHKRSLQDLAHAILFECIRLS